MNTEKMPGNVSTLCGALLNVIVTFNAGDIVKTCMLGVIGTIVSYTISRVLKALFE